MNDSEFDALARSALGPSAPWTDGGPDERVWRRVRPPGPRWLPSFGEIALATAVGGLVLFVLGSRQPELAVAQRRPPAKPVAERTYVAVSSTTFP